MLKQLGTSRAALLGVLFAMVAFSYAVATSTGISERSVGASIRAVGSLTFTNPIIKDAIGTDRDLGLAVVGSGFSRYCRAAGGVPPYTFSVTTNGNGLASANLGLAANGLVSLLTGKTGISDAAGTTLRFGVTVKDSNITSNANVTEMFRISMLPATYTLFKFANGPALDDGVRGRLYSSKIELINGKQPLGQVTASNVTVNGAATANKALGDVGLSVTSNGNIAGIPVVLGKVEFDASCTDSNGTAARSKDGTTVGQHFVINLADGAVSSGVVATGITVKAGAGAGKDSVKYAGLTNLTPTAVAGSALQLYIGPYASPVSPTFDIKGKAVLKADKKAGIPGISASISSKGQLKVTTSGETITAALSAQMLVKVVIGGVVVAENLPFTVKQTSKGSTYTYKTGAALPGGTFLITSVTGKDDTKSATPADSWKVSFIAQPATGGTPAQSFAATNADVTIGTAKMPIGVTANTKGALKSVKAPAKTANIVTKLAMDPAKGKGSVQTSALDAAKTGIPMGSNPGSASAGGPFFMNITLNGGANTNAVYQGEGTKQIIPAKKGWTSNIK